jgi:ketosteroid isomerase-like protein
MSQETPQGKREQAEAVVAALNARDFEALGEMPFHPDMELRSTLTAVEGGTTYHGIQGVRQWAQDLDSIFERFHTELIDVREVDDDRAIVIARVTGRARTSGAPFDERRTQIWTWRNGKMWRNEVFSDPREAFKAAGISEKSLPRED